MFDDGRPLFLQVAESVEDDIVAGVLGDGAQLPSVSEFASFHGMNPATANKGVNLLVDRGVVHKRRGIGMFVAEGARERVREERRQRFVEETLAGVLVEAERLGIPPADVARLVTTLAARTNSEENR